jgi:hypothetical protein
MTHKIALAFEYELAMTENQSRAPRVRGPIRLWRRNSGDTPAAPSPPVPIRTPTKVRCVANDSVNGSEDAALSLSR